MSRPVTLVSNRVPIADDAAVAWIGPAPADEESQVVWQALTGERVSRYGALVERVAERLFRRDLQTIGAAADIGFFRPFYVAHARGLVAALDGRLLRIGSPA